MVAIRDFGLVAGLLGFAPLLAWGCSAGGSRSQSGSLGTLRDPLYLEFATSAGRTLPVCYDATTMARPNFAQESLMQQQSLSHNWVQFSGFKFSGFGACPSPVPSGTVQFHIVDDLGGPTGITLFTPLTVSVLPNHPQALAHEFGHALGFGHEQDRPDFHDQSGSNCQGDNVSGGDALGTVPDPTSIMHSCGELTTTSYWDRVGFSNLYGHANYFADVNGDGKADAIVVNPNATLVRLSNGSSLFGAASDWTGGPLNGEKGVFFADVNGDGKADAIALTDSGVYVRTSTGSAFSAPVRWRASAFYGDRLTLFADVTGDGRADGIAIGVNGTYVSVSTGSGLLLPFKWGSAFMGEGGTFFADVNGDGKADAIALRRSTELLSSTAVWVRLAGTTSFGSATQWGAAPVVGDRATLFADMNGDGKADAVAVNDNGISVRLSSGSAFGAATTWDAFPFWGERGTFLADFNGDGKADALAVNDPNIKASISNGSAFNALLLEPSIAAFYADRNTPACVNGVKNGSETDVDCGGACLPCAAGKVCSVSTDCRDGSCVAGVCTLAAPCVDGVGCNPPSCFDGAKNGLESDVDCGGVVDPFNPMACDRCADGRACAVASDCASKRCQSGACQAASCSDGLQDGNETDVDCGGGCSACADGKHCNSGAECSSGFCHIGNDSRLCQPAHCANGAIDGGETDLNCGGGACSPCKPGKVCSVAGDCGSGICTAGHCQPTCSDGILNNDESDVDCGGECAACAAAHICRFNSDCASGLCSLGACRPTTCFDGVKNGDEKGVDCGGSCAACANGASCLVNADCVSKYCFVATSCSDPGCHNFLQDNGETGVDCGGPCAACP